MLSDSSTESNFSSQDTVDNRQKDVAVRVKKLLVFTCLVVSIILLAVIQLNQPTAFVNLNISFKHANGSQVHDTQRLPLGTTSIPGNKTSAGNKTETKIVLKTVTPSSTTTPSSTLTPSSTPTPSSTTTPSSTPTPSSTTTPSSTPTPSSTLTPSSTTRPTPPLVLLDHIKNLEIALSRISKTDLVAVEKLVSETLERMNVSRPLHPHMVRDVCQMVEGRYEIHAFSAYYDDRPTLDEPLIRIVTIVNPDVEKIPVFCLHWYNHRERPSLSVTFRVDIGAGWYQNNRGFKEIIYSCKLPSEMGVPGNVSLIVVPHVIPSTLLRVNIPVKPKSSAEVIEFGHCPPIRYWNHDIIRLVELLELERLLGIKEVNIYGTEIDNATMSVIDRYVREGFVVYTDMPSIIPANKKQEVILFGSSPAINDYLLKNMYRYKYVVNTDLDEVIVPRGDLRNYSEMLSAIELSRGKNKEPALSYIFRNTYFFLDLGAVSEEPKYLAMERFQRRLEPSGPGYSVKSITRSLNCAGLHNHYCWGKIWNKASVFDLDVDFIHGANQHYKKCHFGETECNKLLKNWVLDKTMEKFQKPLDDAVKNKLKTFSLV